jgi:cell division protein FtsW
VTGITLPFLSYGGSSLTLTLAAVGILMNLSRFVRKSK